MLVAVINEDSRNVDKSQLVNGHLADKKGVIVQ